MYTSRTPSLATKSTSIWRRDLTTDTDPLIAFSHGLAGVDQKGNYLWTDVLVFFFIVILFALLCLRIMKLAFAHLRHLATMSNLDQQSYWRNNQTSWWPYLNRHLFLAPLWKNRHNRSFQLSAAVTNGTLPGRFHVALLLTYILSNISYMLVLPWNNPVEESVTAALRGRSGTLAVINLIPTVLFALRNNPLIPLLKVSYDDFNLLHRWGARMVIVESFVHVMAWFSNSYHAGSWDAVGKDLLEQKSYSWGMVAAVIFVFIAIQAWAPVRHSFYETFLNIHRLLVLFALIGVYVHLDTHHLPQLPWIKIVFSLWGLEWLFRLTRILYFNVGRNKVTRVKVEALPGEACKVTFDMVRPWHIRPGCHVHMYLPRVALWSSHPFSVAWSVPTSPASTDFDTEKFPMTEDGLMAPSAPRQSRTISLVCRARTGMTRKMYDLASSSSSGSFTTYGAIEGPYGGHDSLSSYGTVVLFAGGVGITHQCMYVRQIVEDYSRGLVATRKLLLVWTIPDVECLEWIRPWMNSVLAHPGRKEILRIQLFITKPGRQPVQSESQTVQMFPGRCDVQTIIDKEIASRVGAMAVTVCGSGGFSDSVRTAVRSRVEVGAIDFIEEAFTY